MMELFIEPVDVWLFRDGRPFSAGVSHRATGPFPPRPTTVQGALRAKVLALKGVSLADYARGESRAQEPLTRQVARQIGWPEDSAVGSFHVVGGPFLAYRDDGENLTVFYSVPADVVRLRTPATELGRPDQETYGLLAPLRDSPFAFSPVKNAPPTLMPLWHSHAEAVEEAVDWLPEAVFEAYLRGEPPPPDELCRVENADNTTRLWVCAVRDDELFEREPRFGFKFNLERRRPEEAFLYQAEFVRPGQGVGIWVAVEGLEPWPETGLLALGGEARAARYTVLQPGNQTTERVEPITGRFKVYLATPAYFATGWGPSDWSAYFEGAAVELVAAAVKTPHAIGGWRVAQSEKIRGPKPMRHYVSAGSVYFLHTSGEVTYTGRPLTEVGGQIGYGQIRIGGWNNV